MPNYNLRRGSVQWRFHESRAPLQMMSGAFANGKTTAGVVKGLKIARDYPGSEGLIARETYPKLNDTVRKVFFKWCPPNWIKRKPTQEENSCYLTNGSVVHFRYLAQRGKNTQDGTTTSNLLSAYYDWIFVDQIEDPQITHKDFLDLIGRLRGQARYRPADEGDPSMPDTGPRWFMMSANPAYNWVYKEIVHPLHVYKQTGEKLDQLLVDEDTGDPILEVFEGDIYSNAENLAPDYIRNMEASYKGQMRDRFLLGKWAAYEGLVYPQFDMGVHLLSRTQMLEYLQNLKGHHVQVKVIEGYDFGLVKPTCYLLAFVDHWGRVFVIDGFYQKELPYSDGADKIKEIREDYKWILPIPHGNRIYADPAIFRRTVVAGRTGAASETVSKLLDDCGIKTRVGNNEISSGIAKVGTYLGGRADIPHIITGLEGPLIYFAKELNFIESEFAEYFWKKNPLGVHQDEPIDNNDHAMDTIKYLLTELPKASDIIIPKAALPPKWMQWYEVEMDRADVR